MLSVHRIGLLQLWIALLLSPMGCASLYERDIDYGLDDVPKLSGGPLATYSLAVMPFVDARPPEALGLRGSFDSAAVVEREGDDWYFNSDDHYSEKPISRALTNVVIRHLTATGLFDSVALYGELESPDLLLEGTFEKLEAYRDREIGKQALVSQMGLIGLAIQATAKSPYEAHVVLSDLKLSRPADGVTVWIGQVEERLEGETPLSTSSLVVYDHANDALKGAVGKLVDELSRIGPLEVATPAVEDGEDIDVEDAEIP